MSSWPRHNGLLAATFSLGDTLATGRAMAGDSHFATGFAASNDTAATDTAATDTVAAFDNAVATCAAP